MKIGYNKYYLKFEVFIPKLELGNERNYLTLYSLSSTFKIIESHAFIIKAIEESFGLDLFSGKKET